MRGMGKWAWAGMPQVCREWEAAAQSLDDTTTRLVLIRNGIVLAKDGGVLGMEQSLLC
jgi:NAD dependent epimerase/dehydratase family enzyme